MSEDFIPTEDISWRSRKKLVVLALAVVFLLAVSYGAFQNWLPNRFGLSDLNGDKEVQKAENVGLDDESVGRLDIRGNLILSGASKSSSPQRLETFSLRLNDEPSSLLNESAAYSIFSSSFVEFEDAQAPEDLFFKVLTFATSTDGTQTATNITYHYDVSENLIRDVTTAPEQEQGTMSYSPGAKLLAYSSVRDLEAVDGDLGMVWNWDVLIWSFESGELMHTINGAANPVWSQAGEVLFYSKAAGLYAYDFASGTELPLLDIRFREESEAVRLSTMFDISPDGNYLVLTGQGRGQIEVYEIVEEPLDLRFIGRIVDENASFSWPVISPDGKTYAVLAKDIEGEDSISPRVEVRALLGRDVLLSYPLSDFDPKNVFLDDWIAKPIGN